MENKTWVSYKKIKEAVTMQMVLEHYKVTLRRSNKTNWQGRCPLPTHSSDTSVNSFGAAARKWACKSASCVAVRDGRTGGNVIDFVALMERCSFRDAALKMAEWFAWALEGSEMKNGAGSPPPHKGGELAAREKEASSDNTDEVNPPLKFSSLKGVDPLHPYLKHRGIKPETAQYFGAGYFGGKGMMHDRIVFPIHDERRQLVAYAGRALSDDDLAARYKFPPNFKKRLCLFNLHRVLQTGSRKVIVVEGFFGAMKVHQAGFPYVVALMGSSLSDVQQQLIVSNFDRVLLMLDGDEAGETAREIILPKLQRVPTLEVGAVSWDTPQIQPDRLSSEALQTILSVF